MSKHLAIVALLSSTAAANGIVATDGPAPLRGVDSRIGMLLGGAYVGESAGFSYGFSGAMGYRFGEVTLRGLFDYYRVGEASQVMPRRGRSARLGAAARYELAGTDDGHFGAGFWGELGAGFEHIEWRAGGVLDRLDGELAFGLDIGARGERDRHGHRRDAGYFIAMRSLIGRAPEVPGAVPTCAGPCTMATTPPRTDVSIFVDFGVHLAR
jgi:hypothetical protein